MLENSYISRLLTPPKESFFLFGPRGTGKSTWLKKAFPNALFIDFLDSEEERFYSARPEKIKETVAAMKKGQACVLDEVQRVPGILPMVHALIEDKVEVQFILTGSSSRKLRRSLSDLLAGRALLRYMHPFLAAELKEEFSLEKALKIGLVPMVWESANPEEKLRSYAALYLKEEVQAEGIVRQVGDFARFMEVASFSHGALLNTSQIAREAQVKRQTVDNYLHILQDLLLAFTLPVFTRRAQRAVIAHPKFYYFDPGIFRSLRPRGPLDRESEIEGAALEGLVATHLQSWAVAQLESHQLAFWRTRSGVEVDFVLYGPKGFLAIEVKGGSDVSKNDLKGLMAFHEEYPEATCYLLYRGKRSLVQEGILCMPVTDFLMTIHPDKTPGFD